MAVMFKPIAEAALIAALITAASLGQARADSRITSFATFMHIGPGRQYAVSDEVPTRTTVDVAGCEKNWCQIRYGAATGWIDQRMLAPASPPLRPAGAATGECVDFARTGWPNAGDHERLCLPPAGMPTPPPR